MSISVYSNITYCYTVLCLLGLILILHGALLCLCSAVFILKFCKLLLNLHVLVFIVMLYSVLLYLSIIVFNFLMCFTVLMHINVHYDDVECYCTCFSVFVHSVLIGYKVHLTLRLTVLSFLAGVSDIFGSVDISIRGKSHVSVGAEVSVNANQPRKRTSAWFLGSEGVFHEAK